MLLLHHIIASVVTLGYVRSLHVPASSLYENVDSDEVPSQLVFLGLQYLLNSRRNEQQDLMRELLRESVFRERQVRGLKNGISARRGEQQDMMMDLLRNSLMNNGHVIKSDKVRLRQATTPPPTPVASEPVRKNDMPSVVEQQLKHALSKKSSALYDKPYIVKKGEKEFLVLNPADLDPFISVIPNDIYYNVQKTCVNWLEDCNEQGIRSKIFHAIRSPYL